MFAVPISQYVSRETAQDEYAEEEVNAPIGAFTRVASSNDWTPAVLGYRKMGGDYPSRGQRDGSSCPSRPPSMSVGRPQCPLWVITGHFAAFNGCLLHPRKRTSFGMAVMSVPCHIQTCQASGCPGIEDPVGSPLASRWVQSDPSLRALRRDELPE